MNRELLFQLADEQFNWTVSRRRALHRVPEEGFKEYKTQRLICDALDEIGIPYTTERTWVVGIIEGAHPGRVVALRADMDALPVTEPMGCSFRSEHNGWMHACGHDMHVAIQLGVARLLYSLRDKLCGTVKLLFQPAEETTGGAHPMVKAGVLENPTVDVCYGLHVAPRLPVGMVETRVGALNASTDRIHITVHGKGGHAAYPESSVDAIVCASQIISALQTLVSRNISPLSNTVLSFGSIHGGQVENIICDEVKLFGTLRTIDPKLRTFAKRRIREIAQNVALAFGATAEVSFDGGYIALINHQNEAEHILSLARELFGCPHVQVKAESSMGAEDFAYFIENTPGAFYDIGCTPIDHMPGHPLHSPHFIADERCIKQGIIMQTALVLSETGTEI